MPGPLAKTRLSRSAAKNTPSRKVKAHLAARVADFDAIPNKDQARAAGREFHKPGSQNRSK